MMVQTRMAHVWPISNKSIDGSGSSSGSLRGFFFLWYLFQDHAVDTSNNCTACIFLCFILLRERTVSYITRKYKYDLSVEIQNATRSRRRVCLRRVWQSV
jgi:hypothetical protein